MQTAAVHRMKAWITLLLLIGCCRLSSLYHAVGTIRRGQYIHIRWSTIPADISNDQALWSGIQIQTSYERIMGILSSFGGLEMDLSVTGRTYVLH